MNTTALSSQHPVPTTSSDLPRSDQDRPGVDTTTRTRDGRERALVIGGGGSAGNAWLIGVIAGLADAGLDVTNADVVIGTSAGATAAAQILGASPAQLLADIISAAPQDQTAPVSSDRGRGPSGPRVDHLGRTNAIIAAAENPADMRRRMGAAARDLDAASDGPWSTRWRPITAARLPSLRWPEQLLLITAVDAD
jgi:NTE family protein